jgi:hypothetical protein
LPNANGTRRDLVNCLLTIPIKVNVPVIGASRRLTTGDDHEVQEGTSDPRALELALRFRLGWRRQRRLSIFRRKAGFIAFSDDLRLGADRLLARPLCGDNQFSAKARFVTRPGSRKPRLPPPENRYF